MEEQSRSHQEDHRERDLRDDEGIPELPRRAPGLAACPRERRGESEARSPPGRRQPECESGQDREGEREEDHPPVDGDALEARQSVRHRGEQEAGAPRGERQTGGASGQSQHDAFREGLPHEPPARSAKGCAHGELPAAGPRAGEQQVGEVGARDQEDHADGAGQDPQGTLGVADDVVEKRHEVGGEALVLVGVRGGEPLHRRGELGPRRRRRRAGRQAQDRAEEVGSARLRCHRVRDPDRHEDVGVRLRQAELGRENADDGVGLAAERDRAADDRRIARPLALPETVGQSHDALTALAVVVLRERAPRRRAGAESLEEARRHVGGADFPGLAVARQVHRHGGRAAHRRERMGGGFEIRELEHRDVVGERDQPPGLGIRQGGEEDAIEDAEDGGVGADAERDRQDRGTREGRGLGERARGLADVLEKSRHGVTRSSTRPWGRCARRGGPAATRQRARRRRAPR